MSVKSSCCHEDVKTSDRTIIQSAFRMAKASKASAVLLSLDPLTEIPDESPPKGCRLIFVSQRTPEELSAVFPNGSAASVPGPVISLPKTDMTRLGQVKMGVLLALSNQLITLGDKIVFVVGVSKENRLDSILFLDTARESEILTSQGVGRLIEGVKPEVFEAALGIALELGSGGREGRQVGTILVIGDEQKVLQLSKQMIINPFKGYTDEECNILDPKLKETIREFAALDGAFLISGEGLVLSAGRYLGAGSGDSLVPRGLGARHIAAAGITAMSEAVAIVVSESTGDVRIFKNGKVLMEIEKPVRAHP